MATLTILRHGKSIWNKEKRFTGWTDIALSPRGIAEAKRAGELLKARGVTFDLCFTSYLNRASETLRIVLETMNLSHVPVQKDWRLNERHYGVLQGLNWWEARKKYGAKQVLTWQRHFDVPPPPLEMTDTRFPGNDPLYSHLSPTDLPQSESLKDTLARLLPFWHDVAVPELHLGKHLLIVAHHNSLRGLLKHLDNISDADISNVTIRTADPILYELDEHIVPIGRENLLPRSAFSQFAQKILGRWLQGISR
jgi:2,3-bisphosphoglycerate-dependent phosphoglycerate mutase